MYCFLTTSDIQTCVDYGDKKPHCATMLDGMKFFTRGKLEAALASGKKVVVITSRSSSNLREHDVWWRALVGDSIHCMEHRSGGEAFTRFCKEVVESYGVQYPMGKNQDGMTVPLFWTAALPMLNGA